MQLRPGAQKKRSWLTECHSGKRGLNDTSAFRVQVQALDFIADFDFQITKLRLGGLNKTLPYSAFGTRAVTCSLEISSPKEV